MIWLATSSKSVVKLICTNQIHQKWATLETENQVNNHNSTETMMRAFLATKISLKTQAIVAKKFQLIILLVLPQDSKNSLRRVKFNLISTTRIRISLYQITTVSTLHPWEIILLHYSRLTIMIRWIRPPRWKSWCPELKITLIRTLKKIW